MGFYNRMRIGRIISRMTSDCEALRVGVQEVLFVSLVGGGQMIVAAGFTGGRVLEPGCGTGRFLTGAPAGLPITAVGVEVDPIAAGIAARLNPDATIHAATLQAVPLGNRFDLAIGNVPFSQSSVYDSAAPFYSPSLHAYFVGRALSAVRDGGYVAVVGSRHLLDGTWLRDAIMAPALRADFVGAVRLPTGMFREDGTDAVADVLLLRRNVSGPLRPVPATVSMPRAYGSADRVTSYFTQHPARVCGEMTVSVDPRAPLTVRTDNANAAVAAAFADLASDLLPYGGEPDTVDFGDVLLADEDGRMERSFHLDGGGIVQIVGGVATPRRASKELAALIGLRDAAVGLLAAEADWDTPDEDLDPLRATALARWGAYVAAYGPLNRGHLHEGAIDPDTGTPALSWRRPPLGGFRADPDYASVMALETYDPDTGDAGPAPILTRRVNRRPVRVEKVDIPGEALAVSLGETGRVDRARVAGLLTIPEGDVEAVLGALVFPDPDRGGDLVPARVYLAGNVRNKLAVATRAAARDPRYRRCVDALAEVIPADLGPDDIDSSLGAPWISADHVTAFARDILGSHLTIEQVPGVGSWIVEGTCGRTAAALPYAAPRADPAWLLQCALNGAPPIIYDEERDRGRTRKVRNVDLTVAAQAKLSLLADTFTTWLWSDADRSAQIVRDYNDRFNSHVVARPDGAHLTFPGLADGEQLWPWQRDVIDMVVSTPATLCGHAVGSGKTRSMVGAAVTLRQFGLATKPMLVVPNHLLDQISREARQTFPGARFLIAGKEDLAGDARRLFAARCATGDWDAVIITHSGFTSIPVSDRNGDDIGRLNRWREHFEKLCDDDVTLAKVGLAGGRLVDKYLRNAEQRVRDQEMRGL